jgi:hypothetical protein
MYSQRLRRLGELWEEVGVWTATAFWLAILAGATAFAEGPKWLYISLVVASSLISAWTLFGIARFYWQELLDWLFGRVGGRSKPPQDINS